MQVCPRCILMLPVIADEIDSADEERDMDMWESSGLDLIVRGES